MKGIKAILWDYDATLVDSAKKNMEVIVQVLRHFDPEIDDHLPQIAVDYDLYQEANHRYTNWHELYIRELGFREEQLDEAGRLWGPEQALNKRLPDMFPGMAELLTELKDIPMGICSQNEKENIKSVLHHY